MTHQSPPAWPAIPCPDCGGRLILRAKPERWRGGNPWVYLCENRPAGCGGLMSAHPDGAPQGVPAPAEVRRARRITHSIFDRLWLDAHVTYSITEDDESARLRAVDRIRQTARRRCYRWLAHQLGIPVDGCHISHFDLPTLRRVYAMAIQMEPADIRAWWKVRKRDDVR